MRMTKHQFDEAVDLLEQEVWPDDEDECRVRVFTASYFVMRQRLRLPEDEAWVGPSTGELSGSSSGSMRFSANDLSRLPKR